jgi:hypothetical protein
MITCFPCTVVQSQPFVAGLASGRCPIEYCKTRARWQLGVLVWVAGGSLKTRKGLQMKGGPSYE